MNHSNRIADYFRNCFEPVFLTSLDSIVIFNLCALHLMCRVQRRAAAGMLQPEQLEQQRKPPWCLCPPGGPRAACGQLGYLLWAPPAGFSGCALLLGKIRNSLKMFYFFIFLIATKWRKLFLKYCQSQEFCWLCCLLEKKTVLWQFSACINGFSCNEA